MKVASLLVLLVLVPVVQAEEPITVKRKPTRQGDSVRVMRQITVTTKSRILGPQGAVLRETDEKKSRLQEHNETVITKEGDKTATRVEREYVRCEFTQNGSLDVLPVRGKTVLVELNDGKYSFRFKDGSDIPGKLVELLGEDFSPSKKKREFEKLVMPKVPVKAGDTWTLDMKAIAKDMEEKDQKGIVADVDEEKSTGTGKLVKTYQKDGRLFGEMSFTLTLPLKSIGSDKARIEFENGSLMSIRFTFDGCIDGTADTGVMTSEMNLKGTGSSIDAPGFTLALTTLTQSKETLLC